MLSAGLPPSRMTASNDMVIPLSFAATQLFPAVPHKQQLRAAVSLCLLHHSIVTEKGPVVADRPPDSLVQ